MDKNIFNTENGFLTFDQIGLLTALSATLKPISEVTEALGYTGALRNYLEENDNIELKSIYEELTSNIYGVELLHIAMTIRLFERDFIKNGIDEGSVAAYNELQDKFKKLVVFNNGFQCDEDKNSQVK